MSKTESQLRNLLATVALCMESGKPTGNTDGAKAIWARVLEQVKEAAKAE